MRSGTGSCTESASGSYSGSKNSQTGSGCSKTGSKSRSYSKTGSKTGSRSRSYSKTGSGSYSKTGSGYTGSGYTQTGYNQTGQIDLEMGLPMGQPVPPQQMGCCCATIIVICIILAGIVLILLGLWKAGYIFQGDSHSTSSNSVTSNNSSGKSSLGVTRPTKSGRFESGGFRAMGEKPHAGREKTTRRPTKRPTLLKHQKVADGLFPYPKMTTCSVYCKRCINMFERITKFDQFERIKKVLSTKLNMRGVLERKSKSFNHSNFSANFMAKGCLLCNWMGNSDPLSDKKRFERVKSVTHSTMRKGLARCW